MVKLRRPCATSSRLRRNRAEYYDRVMAVRDSGDSLVDAIGSLGGPDAQYSASKAEAPFALVASDAALK
jgi:hypothetical protein